MSAVDTIFQVLSNIMGRYECGSDIKPDLEYLDHLLTREFHDSPSDLIIDPEANPESYHIQNHVADVWHEGSQSFYRAKLISKLTSSDVFVDVTDPPEQQNQQYDHFTPNVRRMVDRFLTWKLPRNFSPDGAIKFDREYCQNMTYWPVGTNLLDAEQTREMFMYVLDYQKESVIGEIEAERYRQIYEEGHTHHHDDEHDRDELAIAAACYASPPNSNERYSILGYWPWENDAWKPSNRRKDLIKAAALLVAEIERIDRLNKES